MWRFTSTVIGALLIHCILCWYSLNANGHDLTELDIYSRQKRQLPLVFNEGGTFKLLLGWAIPIANPAKVSLIFGFNIQFQYPVPPNITFFNKYFPYVNLARKKRSEDEEIRQYERERYTIYHTLEDSLNRMGINGRECLLRTICEAAESPVQHDGYFGELIHLVLTPKIYKFSDEYIMDNDTDYMSAREAGENMFDCRKLYPKCPTGHGLFDVISVLE